jgi:VWFA-related protein
MRALLMLGLTVGILQQTGGDLVELDVVVVDRHNQAVTGLTQQDFHIKEDGKPVEIKTFRSAPNDSDDGGRQLVLLLDDAGVPMGGTLVVQAMAQAIISRQQASDDVTVVRLNDDRDEPFGDLATAMSRIAAYHAGAVPFQNRGTAERALKVIASIARHLEASEHQRKLIVCIGGPRVCNVLEPQPRGYHENWKPWVAALNATSRANAAVYAVMPVAPGMTILTSGGIVENTGGAAFANTSSFDRFVNEMWGDAGRYYLLGYWPAASNRELHAIDVKVARKGVRVRARRQR